MAETLERPQPGLSIETLSSEPLHIARLSAACQMVAALTLDLNQPLTAIINSVNAAKRLLRQPHHIAVTAPHRETRCES